MQIWQHAFILIYSMDGWMLKHKMLCAIIESAFGCGSHVCTFDKIVTEVDVIYVLFIHKSTHFVENVENNHRKTTKFEQNENDWNSVGIPPFRIWYTIM